MAKPNMEAIFSSIANAGEKTASAMKNILAEMNHSDEANEGKLTARDRITSMLDAGTFSEIGTYTFRKSNEYDTEDGFESVICGWGSLNGQLVYVFSQDFSRSKGAVSEMHAKKIADLYKLAMENGAPIIGVFDSAGAMLPEGVRALSGYATMMACASKASGIIPQIAYIPGICAGSASVFASMFDFVVVTEETGSLSVNSPFVLNCSEAGTSKFASETGLASITAKDEMSALAAIKTLVSYLPSNNYEGTVFDKSSDTPNRALKKNAYAAGTDVREFIKAFADDSAFFELYGSYGTSFVTGFVSMGGSVSGVVASNFCKEDGKLTIQASRKVARFVSFCDSFNIPVINIVDTLGLEVSAEAEKSTYAAELAKLASVFASSQMPLVTLIAGQAYGAAYALLGSKAIGADVVYALETAKIGAMNASSAVAFLWNDKIDASTSREDLEAQWNNTCGSPTAAAASGDIDDIIALSEVRMRLTAALEMLSCKSKIASKRRHANMPL